MYWLGPFKYLLDGMLAFVIHNVPVVCDSTEQAKLRAPPGQTCQSYLGLFTKEVGGNVTTLDDGL
jgi:ABC-type multidrug transport system permease subunit